MDALSFFWITAAVTVCVLGVSTLALGVIIQVGGWFCDHLCSGSAAGYDRLPDDAWATSDTGSAGTLFSG